MSVSVQRHHPGRAHGFTLVELMVTVGIISILASLALPSYTAYVMRSKIPAGLQALSVYQAHMEQIYQDKGNYGAQDCAAAVPAIANFALSCTLTQSGQGFSAVIVGLGQLQGLSYSIDQDGVRHTLVHPRGVPAMACWSVRGEQCDS